MELRNFLKVLFSSPAIVAGLVSKNVDGAPKDQGSDDIYHCYACAEPYWPTRSEFCPSCGHPPQLCDRFVENRGLK